MARKLSRKLTEQACVRGAAAVSEGRGVSAATLSEPRLGISISALAAKAGDTIRRAFERLLLSCTRACHPEDALLLWQRAICADRSYFGKTQRIALILAVCCMLSL